MTTTTLFLSYTTAIRSIVRGEVTAEDLESGVFYFGCTKEYVESTEADELGWFCENSDDKAIVHRAIVAAVKKAEAAGRCAFRKQGESRDFTTLERVLKNGGVDIAGWEEVNPDGEISSNAMSRIFRHFGLDAKVNSNGFFTPDPKKALLWRQIFG